MLTSLIGQLTDGYLGSGPGAVITVPVQQTACCLYGRAPQGCVCPCVCEVGGSPHSCARRENQSFPWFTLIMVKTFKKHTNSQLVLPTVVQACFGVRVF